MKVKRLWLKSAFASVLCAALAVCLAFGLPNVKRDNASAADGASAVPAKTFVLGGVAGSDPDTVYDGEPALGWRKAVNEAVALAAENAQNKLVKVILAADWTATATAGGTSFGSGDGFSDGALNVPASANILFDLNGRVLNRGLSSGVAGGAVIISGGNLEITDGRPAEPHSEIDIPGGIITGGYNTGFGGGIAVTGGKTVISGGTVTGNRASGGAGIAADNASGGSAELVINGGAVTDNTASDFGGGVFLNRGAIDFSMTSGARITDNTAAVGGGLRIAGSNVTATVGGEIAGNTATANGGAISLAGNLVLDNASVSGNTATANGGGICVDTSGTLTVNGGAVSGNTAAVGGGIFVQGSAWLDSCSVNNNTGAGVVAATAAKLGVFGTAKITGNTGGNAVLGGDNVLSAGKLITGAKIGVTLSGGVNYFAPDYAEANSKNVDGGELGYAEDPAKFFESDAENKYVILDSEGKLVLGNEAAEWKYNDGAEKTAADYGVSFVFGNTVSAVTLNGTPVSSESVKNVKYEDGKIVSYAFTGAVGGVEVKFEVRVNPKTLTADDMTVEFENDITGGVAYNGAAQIPALTVKDGETALKQDTDYSATGNNNKNIGDASVTVAGKGNYTGSVTLDFKITKSAESYTGIEWQFWAGANWVSASNWEQDVVVDPGDPDNGKPPVTRRNEFKYNAQDRKDSVRAVLTFDGNREYVYAQGVTPRDRTDWNPNMWLAFDKDFVNADTYSVTLSNPENGNAAFADGFDYDTSVTIHPAELDITADILNGLSNLWQVKFGSVTTGLRDGDDVVYTVDEQEVKGNPEKDEYYARYRGGELELVLNENVLIDGDAFRKYLASATVEYTNNKTAGVDGKETVMNTTVKLTFNDNYAVSEGSNVIVLSKEWCVVTIRNSFTTVNGDEPENDTSWTFGGQFAISQLRPESGNTVIYEFTRVIFVGTTVTGSVTYEPVESFAVVFGSERANGVTYYNVTDGGEVDYSSPINYAGDYFEYFADRLGAGSYIMRAAAPRHTGADGVIYHRIVREFNFTVNPYSIVDAEGNRNTGITCSVLNTVAPYTGDESVAPGVELAVNGRVLTEGVDYELISGRISVGRADLTVRGIGGLTGELVLKDAFEIVKADNGWLSVPSIMRWTYNGFDKNINVLSASPALLDSEDGMWFMITTDEKGESPVEGLEKFTLEDGLVSDSVAAVLSSLPVNSYYLFAVVEGNDNYYGLAPAGIPFRVFEANNYWEKTPSVNTWEEGRYNASENPFEAVSRFGVAYIVVTDESGTVVYDSANGVDNLAKAKAGTYVLTATVNGTDNYTKLESTATFRIFAAPGMPWWGTLLIVFASLGVAAAVLLILHKKGVLQMFTGKMVLAVRNKANADATIAMIRENKKNEEAREAKLREKIAAEEREKAAAESSVKTEAASPKAKKARKKTEKPADTAQENKDKE